MRWTIGLAPLFLAACVVIGSADEAERLAMFDLDEDGFADVAHGGTDCDDADPAIHPGAQELCNAVDDDCDGDIDDELEALSYADADGDGFGDVRYASLGCDPGSGRVADATDCDDSDPLVYPGATELCDGLDNDCEGDVDEDVGSVFHPDTDADGFGDPGVDVIGCDAEPGQVTDATDCDDRDAEVHPGATEACNERDDDCDGAIDEGAAGDTAWYVDADGDGHGPSVEPVLSCVAPAGHVASTGDCDDGDATVYPGAVETACDGVDSDCDGADNEANGRDEELCGGSDTGDTGDTGGDSGT